MFKYYYKIGTAQHNQETFPGEARILARTLASKGTTIFNGDVAEGLWRQFYYVFGLEVYVDDWMVSLFLPSQHVPCSLSVKKMF